MSPTPERGVDAETVRREILDEGSGSEPYVLREARVTGMLRLDGAEIRRAVRFEACLFDEAVSLEGATTLAVSLVGCTLPGLRASTTRFGGRLDLRRSVIGERDGTESAVDLVHADIAGGVRLDGAHLVAPGRVALEGVGSSPVAASSARTASTRRAKSASPEPSCRAGCGCAGRGSVSGRRTRWPFTETP